MAQQNDTPSGDTVRAVLDVVAPTHSGFTVHPLPGSYSNHTHLVTVEFTDSPPQQIVLRRYNEANGDCAGKARREFQTLSLLQGRGIPAPTPIYLDDNGKLLGSPGIITAFVPGRQIDIAYETHKWADNIERLAQMLARIHTTPFDDDTQKLLMNANVEAAWFLKAGVVPDYMQQHPDGEMVWETVFELLPQIQPVPPVLLHLDFWSGNILWDEGRISAVVDWEEAAYGEPGIDVAYFCMELYLLGLEHEVEKFLRVYEQEIGQQVAHLGLWELAAAARPMIHLDEWITNPLMDERFRRFIANAKARASS